MERDVLNYKTNIWIADAVFILKLCKMICAFLKV